MKISSSAVIRSIPIRLLDTDFYEYLGVSVRTPKGDFLGRLRNVDSAVAAHRSKRGDDVSEILGRLHEFLVNKFKGAIAARK